MRNLILIVAVPALAALTPAGLAHADPGTECADQLHTYGIYGQKDYNAWIGKIACKRLFKGTDADALTSVAFASRNLQRGPTAEKVWQFLAAAINNYCPEKIGVLQDVPARSDKE